MICVNAVLTMKVRHGLRRSLPLLTVLATLVAVGGGTAIAAVAAAKRSDTAFERLLRATHAANIDVFARDGSLRPALLDRVMQIEGVTGASQFAFVAVANPAAQGQFFAFAVVAQRGESDTFVPVHGKKVNFASMAADEVVVEESTWAALGVDLGESLSLATLNQEQFEESLEQNSEIAPKGPTVSAKVVSVGRLPDGVSDAPDPMMFFPPAWFAVNRDRIGNCVCTVRVTAERQHQDAVIAALKLVYPSSSVAPTEDLGARINESVSLQRRAWLFIAASIWVATMIATAQAALRLRRALQTEDSTWFALGMTKRQRRLSVLLTLAPAAVGGALGAVVVAYVCSGMAPVGITRKAEPQPGLRFDETVLIPGAALVMVSAGALFVATILVPASRQRRALVNTRFGPTGWLGTTLLSGPGRGGVVGVILALAGLVTALTMQLSINRVLTTPRLYGANFDASNFAVDGRSKGRVAEVLAHDPDIEAVALVWEPLESEDRVRVVGKAGTASVLVRTFETKKDSITIVSTKGRFPVAEHEAAVGAAVLRQIGANVGDRVKLIGPRGSTEMQVVGDNFDPGENEAGTGFATTLEGLRRVSEPVISGIVVRYAPGADRTLVNARHPEAALEPVTPPGEVRHIGELGGLPTKAAVLLSILGAVALLNTSVLTVRVGRHAVAVSRALGLTTGQVIRAHVWQGLATGAISATIGGAIGLAVGRTIQQRLVTDVGAIPELVIPVSLGSVAAGGLLVCLACAFGSGCVAAKRKPSVSLRTE